MKLIRRKQDAFWEVKDYLFGPASNSAAWLGYQEKQKGLGMSSGGAV